MLWLLFQRDHPNPAGNWLHGAKTETGRLAGWLATGVVRGEMKSGLGLQEQQ